MLFDLQDFIGARNIFKGSWSKHDLIVGESSVWSVCWLIIYFVVTRDFLHGATMQLLVKFTTGRNLLEQKRVNTGYLTPGSSERPRLFHLDTIWTTHCFIRQGYGWIGEPKWTRGTGSSCKQQVDIPYGDCHHGGVHGGGAFIQLVFHEQPFQSPWTPQLVIPWIHIFWFHSLVWPGFGAVSVYRWLAHRVWVLKLKVSSSLEILIDSAHLWGRARCLRVCGYTTKPCRWRVSAVEECCCSMGRCGLPWLGHSLSHSLPHPLPNLTFQTTPCLKSPQRWSPQGYTQTCTHTLLTDDNITFVLPCLKPHHSSQRSEFCMNDFRR